MTQNQIAFAKLREDIRHNLASEGYTGIQLAEAARHNEETEGINWYQAQESGRHNRATESLDWYKAPSEVDYNEARSESVRHKITLDDLYYDLDLSKFEEQKWKDLWATWNDSKRVSIAQQEIDAQIAEWVNRYNLDVDKWYNSQEALNMSNTIRNGVAAGKDMVGILSIVAKLLMAALA